MADKNQNQTLITPDGREYVATSEREALRLTRTAGYRPKKAAAPKPDNKSDDKSTK